MAAAKIGVAFGGGAARGWAHIGVLRALIDAGIRPDYIAGTSIGAVVGGCYTAGKLDELEHFAACLTRRTIFGYFDINLSGSGLINGHRLGQTLEAALGEQLIEELDTPFTAVATEIGTGHEVWLSRGSIVDALRASYAIPGVFKPVRFDGRWLFDGALVNPIPVTVCRAMGAQYVIAINLNADLFGLGTVLADIEAHNQAPESSDAPAIHKGNGWGARKLLKRQLFGRSNADNETAPSISTVMVDAFNIVHDRIARSRLAGDPPDVMITPRLSGFGLFEFHRAEEMIERGAQATKRVLSDVHDDLDKAPPIPRPTVISSGQPK
ncbi:MAG: patatin-like phospholipase family protein [Hyphomicrobiaceae bacterium]